MPVMSRLLIHGATCVLPSGTREADVLVEDGRILDIDPPESAAGAAGTERIDASGRHLLPGVVDSHVHFREPGLTRKEDLASGSRAAASGGVTTFFDMPNVVPPTTTVGRLHAKLDRAARTSLVNYGFYIAATNENLDELRAATRTPGIKIFVGSSTGNMLVDDQDVLEAIFERTTLPLCGHCEDEETVRANAAALDGGRTPADHSDIRNEDAAVRCVERIADLARRHGHRFHVLHVSTAGECAVIERNADVLSGEACPHHLLLDTTAYETLGTRAQVNPALRPPDQPPHAWDALRRGVLQAVVTDHAPHLLEEKAQDYPASPSGLPAIENSLILMLDQVSKSRCTLEEVVHWMCDAPARIWDAVDKGRIEPGYDADLVIVDLEGTHEIRDERQYTRAGWSPWHGTTCRGRVLRTIVGGRTVFNEGQFDEDVRGTEVRFEHERGGWWGSSAAAAESGA